MHGGRVAYFVPGEGLIVEPPGPVPGGAPPHAGPLKVSSLKFGRMFGRARPLPPADGKDLFDKLLTLGRRMNEPAAGGQQPANNGDDSSDIPAGYTYLGQFIAHEITFDDTGNLLQPGMNPNNQRTPQIDLDSLYGGPNGPRDMPELYTDGVRLKVGQTSYVTPPKKFFPNDLPRDAANKANPKKALLGDERNDENLVVAQTHVAFIRFHNAVVQHLKDAGHGDDDLFECARRQVIRHFQWVILYDYLPRIVDGDVLDCVLRHGLRWFRADDDAGLYMPLEFSAAAFRIGHSMVRASYDWNKYHRSGGTFGGPASVSELFQLTGFLRTRGNFNPLRDGFSSGSSHDSPLLTLPSDWVIDWRRFYDFSDVGGVAPVAGGVNRSSKLDTLLNFRLDQVEGFPDTMLEQMQKALTIRNLLRGFYLGLPTGEEVAEWVGETPLTPEQVAAGPHGALLSDPAFRGKTPLWYYVLKEAELSGRGRDGTGGHRLGPVGSRIVAETLVGLIKKSPYSILDEPGWRPKFGRPAQGAEPAKFGMADLLKFAFDGDVNPLGE